MRRRTAVRVELPRDPELRARLYRALAAEAAACSEPATILLEASTDAPVPTVSVRPAGLLDPLLATPTYAALRPVPWCPSGIEGDRPTTASAPRPWGAVRAATPTLGVPDLPARGPLLGSCGRLEVQTFWLSGRGDGRLWAARRARFGAPDRAELDARAPSVFAAVAAEWSRATGVLCRPERVRVGRHGWSRGATRSIPRGAWLDLTVANASRTAEPAPVADDDDPSAIGHAIALGATGSGKTTFLADRAVRAIRRGEAVVAVDLHGDLGPAILARLEPGERERLLAVDVTDRPVVGIAALDGTDERAAGHLVAAVKRLTPDGTDVYWGFRLERIFDAFVRIVQEAGGSLGDLYALLTDADRREVARLATRDPRLARFLDELAPIVRRSPEFLWGAAARLAKVVLSPALAELLAPADGGVPIEQLIEERRPLLVRLPFARVGPEAASFAGSLVLARTYLGLAARRGHGAGGAPVVVVLDEVQGLSPRLIAEMLTDGRKFGVRLVIATQYPERLAPELRGAAAGVSRLVVSFRVPRATSAVVGGWLGLPPAEAERQLVDLPVGVGLARATGFGDLRTVVASAGPPAPPEEWTEAVARTRAEFSPARADDGHAPDEDDERLLLAILAGEERGRPVRADALVEEALGLPGPASDAARLADRRLGVERGGLASVVDGGWRLSAAGARRLGLRTTTGATRETAEHRALLLQTFRIFARHGHRLEIVRQGRYDTTLPDAIFRQIPEAARSRAPRELAAALGVAERGWAWRFFRGRDVHVEAEVSGALRPARIRHGLAKATARGAFALFVVGDPDRARRVRRALRASGAGPDRAQVWTLRAGTEPAPRDGKGPGTSGGPCASSSPST